ncbi:MAG: hypothetical protein GF418_15685, partial [Chitinivibrionales bacterium]|nr:hypothetical protein [Chitinivibrionales bacterium]MBD3397063.1 hypothetical protein [Chitinivibrionales bacterium]
GYSDIVAGAYLYKDGETNEGAAYVWYGSGAGLSQDPSHILQLDSTDALLGYSVACAGDLNGDGYSDLALGAPGYSNGNSQEGAILLYYGSSAGIGTTPDLILESNYATEQWGRSVACAGDVNGDGYSDIIVGGRNQVIFHGGPGGPDASVDQTLTDAGSLAYMQVSSAGDVNGDGYSDVMVGLSTYDNGHTNQGAVWIYHGGSGGVDATPDRVLMGGADDVEMGYGIGCAGDANGDGYADVIVGMPGYTNGQAYEGAGAIYLGSPSGVASSPHETYEPHQGGSYMGGSVASAGDVNGDGLSDVIVGAYRFTDGESEEGAAFVFHGAVSIAPTQSIQSGSGSNNIFGTGISSAGDVNGDGFSDIIIGAPGWHDGTDIGEGGAFVYHGGGSGILFNEPACTLEINTPLSFLGTSVSCAGDINADGYADVIVGAPRYSSTGKVENGAVYAFHGSASGLSTSPAWGDFGSSDSAWLGQCVSGAGDVNGDGFADIIVGAPSFADTGKAYLYLGSESGLSSNPVWAAKAHTKMTKFGKSVASAGDVNGDAFSDVVIGEARHSANGGAAFVFHGSPQGLSDVADWTKKELSSSDRFGCSVASAGDVNGDGYGDVIIGAKYHGADNNGVYVFHGSEHGLSLTEDILLGTDQSGAYFGSDVACAGDVDADGYSDVLVGATYYEYSSKKTGAVFLHLGGPSGVSPAYCWRLQSTNQWSAMGDDVASAGDFNGDGYPELLIAAPNYSGAESYDGRVWLAYCTGHIDGSNEYTLQYQHNGTTPIAPGGICSTQGSAVLGMHARSFLGRQRGAVRAELTRNGNPFNGAYYVPSPTSSLHDLGTSGTELTSAHGTAWNSYTARWRARVQYDLVTAITGQRFGPWRYMPNEHIHEGGYRDRHMAAPAAPTLVSPADDATGVVTTPQLTWNPPAHAGSCQFQVSEFSNFSSTVDDRTVSSARPSTSITTTALSNSTLYYWRVRGKNYATEGTWSTVWSFTTILAPPALDSPGDAATGIPTSPTLTWEELSAADTYGIQVATDDAFSSTIEDEAGVTDTTFAPSELSHNMTYYWRVNATNAGGTSAWSETRFFVTEPGSDDIPALVSPASSSTGRPVNQKLKWNEQSGASSYGLQVSTESDFGTTVVDESGLDDTTHALGGLDNDTKYYWRVNAIKAGGTTGWSNVWNFTTIIALPGTVSLLSPQDDATLETNNARFEWNGESPEVTKYRLQCSLDSSMASTTVDSSLADTAAMVSDLTDGETYWWRVRAKNAAGWGPWSHKASFEVKLPTSTRIPRDFAMRCHGLAAGNSRILRYALPRQSTVSIRLFDLKGREVLTHIRHGQPAGYYVTCLETGVLGDGRYILVFTADQYMVKRAFAILN